MKNLFSMGRACLKFTFSFIFILSLSYHSLSQDFVFYVDPQEIVYLPCQNQVLVPYHASGGVHEELFKVWFSLQIDEAGGSTVGYTSVFHTEWKHVVMSDDEQSLIRTIPATGPNVAIFDLAASGISLSDNQDYNLSLNLEFYGTSAPSTPYPWVQVLCYLDDDKVVQGTANNPICQQSTNFIFTYFELAGVSSSGNAAFIGGPVVCHSGIGATSRFDYGAFVHPGSTYSWNFGESTNFTPFIGPSVSHTYQNPGLYSVTLIEQDFLGNTSCYSSFSNVSQSMIDNTAECWGNSEYRSFEETTNSEENLNVYPNPVKQGDMLSMEMSSNYEGACLISIIDSNGKVVQETTQYKEIPKETWNLDTSSLSSGVYAVRTFVDGDVKYQKLIVR